MPLDHSNYHGYGGGSDHHALIIVADNIYTHMLLPRPSALGIHSINWVSTVREVFASNLSLTPQQVYVICGSEVTNGHRDRYQGRTLIFGVHEGMFCTLPYQRAPSPTNVIQKNITGFFEAPSPVYQNRTRDMGSFDFPDTFDTMMSKKEPITIAVALDIYTLCIGQVVDAVRPDEDRVKLGHCQMAPVFPL